MPKGDGRLRWLEKEQEIKMATLLLSGFSGQIPRGPKVVGGGGF